MFNSTKSHKNLLRREERFSLRKFKNGLASVTVGAVLFFVGELPQIESSQVQIVYASEIDQIDIDVKEAENDNSEELFEFKPETLVSNGTWESQDMLTDDTVVEPRDMGLASTGATTEVVFEDKSVTITATIESTNGQPQGASQFLGGSNQASYDGRNEHFGLFVNCSG